MINQSERFWIASGALTNGGPTLWNVYDFDQRRMFAITGPPALLDNEETAMKILSRYADNLSPEARSIEVDRHARLVRIWSEDPGMRIQYPSCFKDQVEREESIEVTLVRSQLNEIDRLGQCVDLVTRKDLPPKELFVFKYRMTHGEIRREML